MATVAGGPEGTTTEPKELRQTTEMRQAEGRTDTRDVAAEQVGFRDQSNCCLTLDVCSLQIGWLHSFSFFYFLFYFIFYLFIFTVH